MNEYTQQAMDFLARANATCTIELGGTTYNTDWDDKVMRDFYHVTLTTPRGVMRFTFWASINSTELRTMDVDTYVRKNFRRLTPCEAFQRARAKLKKEKAEAIPTAYDVLACLTKYDPGNLVDFCAEFGYSEDSKRAERIYLAVVKEYQQLARIFTAEQMEELQEIY